MSIAILNTLILDMQSLYHVTLLGRLAFCIITLMGSQKCCLYFSWHSAPQLQFRWYSQNKDMRWRPVLTLVWPQYESLWYVHPGMNSSKVILRQRCFILILPQLCSSFPLQTLLKWTRLRKRNSMNKTSLTFRTKKGERERSEENNKGAH